MTIHKEGFRIIIISFLILFLAGVVINYALPDLYYIHYTYNTGATVLFIWILSFFRYPFRTIEKNELNVLSSADGKVVAIEEVEEMEYFKDKRIQVSVFMSPFNVHANWYPVSGKIKYAKYHPGKHLVAFNPKSSLENEMTTTVIESIVHSPQTTVKEILIRQIAGVMARRIVCYAKEGDEANQGEELGFIKLGSRVDFLLPIDSEIKVKLNQKVKGKKTVIGTLVH